MFLYNKISEKVEIFIILQRVIYKLVTLFTHQFKIALNINIFTLIYYIFLLAKLIYNYFNQL